MRRKKRAELPLYDAITAALGALRPLPKKATFELPLDAFLTLRAELRMAGGKKHVPFDWWAIRLELWGGVYTFKPGKPVSGCNLNLKPSKVRFNN